MPSLDLRSPMRLLGQAPDLRLLLGAGLVSMSGDRVLSVGLAYSIYSFTHAYSDGGLFGVYAGTGEDEAAELMPALCEEMRGLANGLSLEELARARAQLKAGLLMSLESTTARCDSSVSRAFSR